MFGCLRLGTGFVPGQEEEGAVHASCAVEHGCHHLTLTQQDARTKINLACDQALSVAYFFLPRLPFAFTPPPPSEFSKLEGSSFFFCLLFGLTLPLFVVGAAIEFCGFFFPPFSVSSPLLLPPWRYLRTFAADPPTSPHDFTRSSTPF
mmetsp:Transcript_33234/g.69927  ORF Transcript_33234/g.69927 Transcript_33234/m.69927 type:complete len:148 (+) Transcript_33234:692-1135(+)